MNTGLRGKLSSPQSAVIFTIVLWCWAAAVLAGLVIIAWPEAPRVPLVPRDAWNARGFLNNSAPRPDDLPASMMTCPERTFWRSWPDQAGSSKSQITSAAFTPSGSTISIPISGYPAGPNNRVYLENLETGEKMFLRYGNVHEAWEELIVRIPERWVRAPLKVVAKAGTRAYVGVGTPCQATLLTDLKMSLAPSLAWHAIICFFLIALTALPRAALACLDSTLGNFARWLFFPLALALIGFLAFFTYALSPRLTTGSCVFLALAGFVWDRKLFRAFISAPATFLRSQPALCAWFFVSLATWICLNAQKTGSVAYAANYRFAPASWSTDNQLPIVIGKALAQGDPLSVQLGPWKVSDRPPAFTGIIAIVESLCGRLFAHDSSRQLFFWIANLTGIAVMATWVFPCWALLMTIRLPALHRMWILGLLSCTPFVFFNTVYAWPKLLSGTLALTGWVVLNPIGKSCFCPRSAVGSGLAFAAALLSHGGVFSSHLAMGIWLSFTQLRRRWATLFLCGLVFFSTIATWLIWIHEVNPPGNALTKYAFTGKFGFEKPDQPVFEAVLASYRQDTFSLWAERKLNSLKMLAGLHLTVNGSHMGWKDEGLKIRRLQFFNLLPTLGCLLLCFAALFPRRASGGGPAVYPHLGPRTLVLIGALSITLQLVIFWGPFAVFEISYGATLAIQIGLLTLSLRLGRKPLIVLTACVILNFLVFWLLSPAIEFGYIRPATFALAIALTPAPAILLFIFSKHIPKFQRRFAPAL